MRCGAQGAGHRAQGAGHRAQGTEHRAQGAGHIEPETRHPIPDTKKTEIFRPVQHMSKNIVLLHKHIHFENLIVNFKIQSSVGF